MFFMEFMEFMEFFTVLQYLMNSALNYLCFLQIYCFSKVWFWGYYNTSNFQCMSKMYKRKITQIAEII